MAEEKKALETTEGIFVGKELLGEGKSEKGEWIRYKMKFKPSLDAPKGFSFTAFSPLKAKNTLSIEELKEGEKYRICYAEREAVSNDGIQFTGKTSLGFYKPKDYSKAAAKETLGKIDLSNFNSFKERYIAALKKSDIKPNVVHMVGSFIASNEKERTSELVEKCKEALKS